MRLGLMLCFCCIAGKGLAEDNIIDVGLHYAAPWAYADASGQVVGIDYDVVKQIFSQAGYELRVELFSHERMLQKFRHKELDFVSPVAFDIPGAHRTLAYMEIEDVAVSLDTAGLNNLVLEDLADMRIVAYQKAADVLGKGFVDALNPDAYLEIVDRQRQFELLTNHKVDLVIGDKLVLKYFAQKRLGKGKIRIHSLFDKQAYPAAAWDPQLVSVFNQGLQTLKGSEAWNRIMAKPRP
ncbi:substrate-binding periplasmic protein [Bowmanella denitrificans]|uniref:substrate-binding periplasmic protein n=1 Tax=Bowmanella denitrificans TaxID=366582 RepID=UPI001558602D|nr:transporter substrate-binding domain-containing protein [Bowmanella denitrificans]